MSHYIFYKIICEDCPDYIYIGSTKSFRSRKNQHKNACINENYRCYNLKIYQKIRENGGWDNWNMIIIDEADNLTFTQARIKEEELRLKYNGNLNSYKAYITEEQKKEYYQTNKEVYKEKKREYKEKNKEKIAEQSKEYYENNKDQILDKQKEYYENNKDQILDKQKEYDLKNKEKIKEYQKEYYKQRYLKKKAEALNKE